MNETPSELFEEDFRQLVEGRFQSYFGAAYPDFPIEYQNAPFIQPENGRWARIYYKNGESFQASIGRTFVERTPGFLQMDVIVRKDENHAEVRRMANKAASFFTYEKLANGLITATFKKKHVTDMQTEPGFFRVMARVYYHYDGFEKLRPLA